MKVAHLTSVHPRYDTRIFLKQCSSLASHGHDVSLIVADGKGNEEKAGVNIFDVGKGGSRWQRILHGPGKVYQSALELDADIYHLHDPELMPIGLKLKKSGKRVIFDAHEDFPKQLLSKPYLHEFIKKSLSLAAGCFEKYACKRFDAVITATPQIRIKFQPINKRVVDINNYPIIGELASEQREHCARDEICFVGGYSQIRGLKELIDALSLTKDEIRLNLVGTCPEPVFIKLLEKLPGWCKVKNLGFLDRTSVKQIFDRSFAGIVTFLPVPNHVEAQPNKMFEYMSAGLPVIGSRFPLWQEIIEGNDCGLCVDPAKPEEIGEAINYLFAHPERAYEMGMNGQKAVIEQYNWQHEEEKLLKLYEQLK